MGIREQPPPGRYKDSFQDGSESSSRKLLIVYRCFLVQAIQVRSLIPFYLMLYYY